MKKHLKLVSGLGLAMALCGVARPAHAYWTIRDGSRVNMNATTASVTASLASSDTTDTRYFASPGGSGNAGVIYDWVAEPNALTPGATSYTVIHGVNVSGTISGLINPGATGNGSSIATATIFGTFYSDSDFVNDHGDVTHYSGSVPTYLQQPNDCSVTPDPITSAPILHPTFSGSLSSWCQEHSVTSITLPDFTYHNYAPGTASTSALSATTSGFGVFS